MDSLVACSEKLKLLHDFSLSTERKIPSGNPKCIFRDNIKTDL